MAITPKQKQVLEFIQSFMAAQGLAPSYQEIADEFGFRSRATVQDYVRRLREGGFLEENAIGARPAARGLALQQTGIHVPLLGVVAAGRPIEHVKNQEFVEVPSSLLSGRGEHFALIVRGDSMEGAGILDGDTVLIKRQATAESGRIIVARVGQEATLKRLKIRRGQVELEAANPRYAPIVVPSGVEFRVEGVLAGLLRKIP